MTQLQRFNNQTAAAPPVVQNGFNVPNANAARLNLQPAAPQTGAVFNRLIENNNLGAGQLNGNQSNAARPNPGQWTLDEPRVRLSLDQPHNAARTGSLSYERTDTAAADGESRTARQTARFDLGENPAGSDFSLGGASPFRVTGATVAASRVEGAGASDLFTGSAAATQRRGNTTQNGVRLEAGAANLGENGAVAHLHLQAAALRNRVMTQAEARFDTNGRGFVAARASYSSESIDAQVNARVNERGVVSGGGSITLHHGNREPVASGEAAGGNVRSRNQVSNFQGFDRASLTARVAVNEQGVATVGGNATLRGNGLDLSFDLEANSAGRTQATATATARLNEQWNATLRGSLVNDPAQRGTQTSIEGRIEGNFGAGRSVFAGVRHTEAPRGSSTAVVGGLNWRF